ncbi:hypothetical protein TSAR_007593 [Trichomalopsis sarcophagae]|uniref:LRRCT domain-containing protein n=1 Tax=Trichomalopsis sarcophagae TaxID=543379 RepID=A0A232F327_9HYME|nr:hypothetical protein TSAR_007593 [Trichomalopsis sarcophagae]
MIFKLVVSVWLLLQWEYGAALIQQNRRVVDLSNRGLQREDFFMKMQHQIKIYEVNELILRGNKFDSFLDCSTKLDNLEVLDLSYNQLKRFFFLCTEEYNLISLNVSHNQIEYINDEALTHRVIKLKELDLSYNDLYVVNDTMLQHMKNLEFLSLASNPIEDNIDAYVFQNLTLLKHLDLRNISSQFFSPSLFEPLVNLEHLDLSYNPIEDVPFLPTGIKVLYICGTNILHLGSFVMPQLRVLALDHSANLTSVLLNNFENLTQLEILSMHDSPRLADIKLRQSSSPLLPKLKRFSLQNCALQTLHEELLPIIQKTAVLDLQNNPWSCDCRMSWLNAINVTTDLRSSLRCQRPEQHRGKLLHDVPSAELECEEPPEAGLDMEFAGSILYPILWLGLALSILGMLGAGFVYYSRGCLGQWVRKMRHRGTDTVSYTNVVESNNDLVRILPTGETNEHADI